jgi:hypothetical protein
MRSVLLTLLLSVIIFCSMNAYARNSPEENSWQNYRHKEMMGFCNIDSMVVGPFFNISRDTEEDVDRVCGNSKTFLERYKCYADYALMDMKKSSELAKIIQSQYVSQIVNKLGITAAKFPLGKDVTGSLDIEVDIVDRRDIDGNLFYTVNHNVTLNEIGLSRFGREGNMLLTKWFSSGSEIDRLDEIVTLDAADMVAIKMVNPMVDKIKKTFREAREYCTKHNLFPH